MRQAFLKSTALAAIMAMVLTGCSDASEEIAYETTESVADQAVLEVSDAESVVTPAGEAAPSQSSGTSDAAQASALPDIPAALPKIAYVYNYGFELTGNDIADLQKKHADMCEAQGPFTCRIVAMSHSGEEGDYASGQLQLAVAAPKARSFGEKLGTAASDAGGEQFSANIAGEDLSKQIVDTDARLQARTVLRDRLLEVLRTRRGSVSELVEAERSVAQVNEEIDQAKGWLAEMRARVAFSRVDIAYRSSTAATGDFAAPIKGAFGSIGAISGNVLAGLIMLLAIIIPLGAAGYGALWLRRRFIRKPGEIAA